MALSPEDPESMANSDRNPVECAAWHKAPVAQLDRVLGFEPSGREFESLRARHLRLTGHVVRDARRPLGSHRRPPR